MPLTEIVRLIESKVQLEMQSSLEEFSRVRKWLVDSVSRTPLFRIREWSELTQTDPSYILGEILQGQFQAL